MASDVDIVIAVATTGVADVYKLSNAMQQLNKVVEGVANPMYNLSARSKALSAAVGSADSSLKAHAKSVGQLARNNSILTNELGRVRKEIAGMGKEYKFATDASGSFRKAAISDLKAYEGALKGIRLRALTEDLKGVAQEQKRLGKDAQFVGRSLIIGLTTPIAGFARYGLQALVSVDKEFVRLNKVLENVAPNIDAAAKKMNVDLVGATKEQSKQLQGMVDRYDRLDKSLGKVSNRFGLAKSLTVGLAGDFAELGIQSEESIVKITELAAVTEKLGDMDIGAAKDLVQSLYFQAQRAMQMSGQGRNMTFEEREIAAIGAATAQLNLFNSVENVTALTLRDLGDAFPEVAAAGSSFGLSMTELAGMLAPMKAAGFEVGASANSIKVSLQRLVAPTKQNADLFKQLSKDYNTNFTTIKGTGLDAIQALIDSFNELKSSAAGQEGAMEFFAKVFGVRQGPRMEVALAQMADFDEVLKSNTVSMDSAEKKLQSYANQAVTAANVTRDVNLPLIKSYKDIGIIARIATTQMKEGETRMIDGFGRVTMEQVKAAREVRQAVTDEIVKAQRSEGVDLIGQVNTEAGRASFIQLAGAANAAEVAQRELNVALGSLDTQISILKNNFKAFATDIIEGVRPAIEKLTDISNKLITAWSNLDERTKKLFSTVTLLIAGATAAIGPMIFVFGQFRLAMGSVARVLFSFLPGLKTMSVEAVAGASAMLRLTKPLTVVGDTVVNTNNKFATFIATLASGDGPVSRLANKIGLMTGALQKQNTASMVLTRSVNRQKAAKIELAAVEGAGAILGSPPAGPTTGFKALSYAPLSGLGTPGALTGPRPGPLGVTARNLVARFGSDKPLRGATGPAGSADSVKNFNRAVREETFRLLEEAGFTKKNIGDMLRTPTSLTRTIVGPASDQARQNVQDAMGEIAAVTKGQRRFDRGAGLRQRFLDREQASILAGKSEAEAKKILNAQQVARQEAKGITTQLGGRGTGSLIKERFFKGVKIDDDTFDTIMGGGIKGRLASSKLNLGIFKSKLPDLADKGAGKFLGGKQTVAAVKGVATFGKDLFTQPTKALGDFVGLFKSGFSNITGVFGKIGPMFAKIGGYIKNPISLFMKFKSIIIGLGPAIMAAVSSFGAITGIGLIIGAIVAIVIVLVKNWDAFVAAIQPGIEALKDTFDILKDAVMGLVQPFLDFFNSIGGEGEGTNAIVATIATTFNILADVIKVLAIALKFVFVEIFGRIIKVALSSLLALLKGIGNFVMGLWKVIKGIFTFNWSSIVDGFKKMGKGIAQVAIGLMGPFADFFVFVLKGVKMIFDQLAKLPGWLGGGVFKKASQGIGAAISFVEDTRNLKKGKGKGGKDTPEVDTDPMQEQIANATGDGLKEGADEGAKELAKRAKQALKDLKKEVQEEIASRIKDAMNDVVDNIKEALKNQKAAALGIYDAQIKKIEDVGKAEEKLTKEQEYQNKLREAEDQRALNRLNTRRSYAMAVYAGQIDEARSIADEGARQEAEDNKKVEEINKDRTAELAEQNRKDMIDSIKDAKEAASKYFDEMIESFTKSAKKITEFPPTTAEEFNTMLNMLVNGGDGFIGAIGIANSIGTTFSESFGGALANLGADTKGPLTSALGEIGKVLTDNNPFGPTGIWNTTIDKTIDALTRKYQGLTNTLTTIIDTKSGSFQKLLDIYTKYQNLVNPAGGSGGSGSGGGGGGNTNGGYGSGFNKDGVKVGNKVAIAAANADLSKIKTYSDKYLETKYGSTNEGKKLIAAIKGTVGSIASSSVLLGGHDAGMHDYMPIVLASKYKDQIRTNSELVYAYIVNNRSQFIKGAGAQGRTDESGRSGFFKGGMLQYGKGGATTGPTQQGIPALLHGGEYVVRNSAVKRYGWGMMQQINQGTYKPKPFENGGMISSSRKSQGKIDYGTSKSKDKYYDKYLDFYDSLKYPGVEKDKAKKEFEWQIRNGGFNLRMMREIWTRESGRNWKNKGTKGRGGFGFNPLAEVQPWLAYGGMESFGVRTADLATPYQQMVIFNRMLSLGYSNGRIRKEPLKPTTALKSYMATGATPMDDNKFGNLAFKKGMIEYWKSKPKDISRIVSPTEGVLYVRTGSSGKRPLIPASEIFGTSKKGNKFSYKDSRDESYTPLSYYKGGLVGNNGDKNKKPTSAADFRKADIASNDKYNNNILLEVLKQFQKDFNEQQFNAAKAGLNNTERNNLNPFKDLAWEPKKKNNFFGKIVDKTSSGLRGVLDPLKTFSQGFLMSAMLIPELAQAEIGAIANYIPGIGKSNKKGNLFNQFVASPLMQTTWGQFGKALKEGSQSKEKVTKNDLFGLKGFAGFFPKVKYTEAAMEEAAQSRPTLGNATTFSVGGAAAYYGLDRLVGGAFEKVTGNKPEWSKEGSMAYGLTAGLTDFISSLMLDPMVGPAGVAALIKSPKTLFAKMSAWKEARVPLKIARAQMQDSSYIKNAMTASRAKLDTELLFNPNAWFHGNKGPVPVFEALAPNLRRERLLQLLDSDQLQVWQLSEEERSIVNEAMKIPRRSASQDMLIGPGTYTSHAGIASLLYAQGGGRLQTNLQPGFYPKPFNQFDLSKPYPVRTVNNSEQFLRTALPDYNQVEAAGSKTNFLWHSSASKATAKNQILRSAIDANKPLTWLYDQMNIVKPQFFKNPKLWTENAVRKLKGQSSIIDWDLFTAKAYKGAPETGGDLGSKSELAAERIKSLGDVKNVMSNYLKKNPKATILDFIQSEADWVNESWFKDINTGKMVPFRQQSGKNGMSPWVYKQMLELLNVPIKLTDNAGMHKIKLTHFAPNNIPTNGVINDLMVDPYRGTYQGMNIQNKQNLLPMMFPDNETYQLALQLWEDAKTVRYGNGLDAYIFDPAKPYKVPTNIKTIGRTTNNPLVRFLKYKDQHGVWPAVKDIFGKGSSKRTSYDLTSASRKDIGVYENIGDVIPKRDAFVHKYDLTEKLPKFKIIKPHDLSNEDVKNIWNYVNQYIEELEKKRKQINSIPKQIRNANPSIGADAAASDRILQTRINVLIKSRDSIYALKKMTAKGDGRKLITQFDDIFEKIGVYGFNTRGKVKSGKYSVDPYVTSPERVLRHFGLLTDSPYLTTSEAYLDFSKQFGYDAIAHKGGVFTSSKLKHIANSVFATEQLTDSTKMYPALEMIGANKQLEDATNLIFDRAMKIMNSKQTNILKKQALASLRKSAIRSGISASMFDTLIPNMNINTQFQDKVTTSRAFGGIVPGFGSQGVNAMLHGGEYVINSSAVKNIGIAALQAMNNMRFNTPKNPSYAGPVSGQSTSTTTTHIYVENFIGEKQWFESMMKDYNITVAPQNQRAAGLNNSTISTYSGINRGL